MFVYEKKLQYPVKIKNPNPKLAAVIISQYGGPDGELGASLRYLSQRYSMPYAELKGLLTDIGTEELGHLEMVGTIVHQLTRNLSDEDIRTAGFDAYFVDHTTGVYPTAASGFPWSAGSIGVTGDMIADLTEDLAAEQKARLTYDNILRLVDRHRPQHLLLVVTLQDKLVRAQVDRLGNGYYDVILGHLADLGLKIFGLLFRVFRRGTEQEYVVFVESGSHDLDGVLRDEDLLRIGHHEIFDEDGGDNFLLFGRRFGPCRIFRTADSDAQQQKCGCEQIR